MTISDIPPGAASAALSIFPSHGEMGPLCRAMDWGATPLGPVESWPESLRTAAALVAHQGLAMNLCWGPELRQIYNDAYRVIMADKHPAGLGASVLTSWAEIRHEIEPLFARVMQGETVYFEDLLLRVDRTGTVEDAYFTFSYSPVRVESGERLSCERQADGIALHVRDDGRGIPADKLEAIFDPFMQVGRALNSPETGVGLGLAISRDLARGMGGELSVVSEVGVGSEFTLTLPSA